MQESNQSSAGTPEDQNPTPGTAATPTDESPSQLQTLRDLLGGDEPAPEPADEGSEDGKAGGDTKKAKPKKFNDLAETLEIELADLYKLEVSASEDGSPVTVEMLKDAHAKREEQTVRELKWEEDRAQKEADLTRARAELQELFAALPKSALKPEALEAAKSKFEATAQQERVKTLEVIPDWRDETKRSEELAGMVEYLKGYGFPASYLTNVFDHRVMRLVRDSWQREARIRKAFEQLESAKKPSPGSKPRPNGAAPKPNATPTQTQLGAGSRLRALLNE